MQAGLPSKEHAPVMAANLACRGVNCIRFHFLDRLAPVGLIAADLNDTRTLDAQQLDRLDFFIAEPPRRGIYADLNLNVGRTYKAGDGVRDFEWLGFPKGLTYSDELSGMSCQVPAGRFVCQAVAEPRFHPSLANPGKSYGHCSHSSIGRKSRRR